MQILHQYFKDLQSKQATRSIFKQTDHDNDFRIRFIE